MKLTRSIVWVTALLGTLAVIGWATGLTKPVVRLTADQFIRGVKADRFRSVTVTRDGPEGTLAAGRAFRMEWDEGEGWASSSGSRVLGTLRQNLRRVRVESPNPAGPETLLS